MTQLLRNLHRAATICFLFVVAALVGGCPAVPVGDPFVEVRLTNDTTSDVMVELTLDAARFGPGGSDASGAKEQLLDFQQGEGVTLASDVADGLTGRYTIAAGGYMTPFAGMGEDPYFPFVSLVVTHDGTKTSLEGEPQFRKRFKQRDGNVFELRVSDL